MQEDWKVRTRTLLGDGAVEALEHACVIVAGIGGVGSNCAFALVRAGIGKLIVVDGDVVAPSNINRQVVAFQSTVGRKKVDVFAEQVRNINPECQCVPIDATITPENIAELLFEYQNSATFLIDAIDDRSAKIALALWAQEYHIPEISCMGTAGKLDATAFEFADIYATEVCPLCRALRSDMKRAGIERLPVLYSKEPAQKAQSGAPLGTISYVPAVAGLFLAQHVIRTIIDR